MPDAPMFWLSARNLTQANPEVTRRNFASATAEPERIYPVVSTD